MNTSDYVNKTISFDTRLHYMLVLLSPFIILCIIRILYHFIKHKINYKKKYRTIIDGDKEILNKNCSICLNSDLNELYVILDCKHIFHKKCIDNWFQRVRSCPNCRLEV
jgi:hypothetical protein